MPRRTWLARQVAPIRLRNDLAVARDDHASFDSGNRPTAQSLALERREIRHSVQVLGPHDAFLFEVDNHQISIGADRDRALLRIDAVNSGRAAGGALDQN